MVASRLKSDFDLAFPARGNFRAGNDGGGASSPTGRFEHLQRRVADILDFKYVSEALMLGRLAEIE
jgi:hypothetical protein